MPVPIAPIARVFIALMPVAIRIAEATRADSPGGKAITEEEVIRIFLGETGRVVRRLNNDEPKDG